MTQQLREGATDFDDVEAEVQQIRAALGQLRKDVDDLKKAIQTKAHKSKCIGTAGGKLNSDLDMQSFRIRNLVEAADVPITNG